MFLGTNYRQDVFLDEYKKFLEIFVLHEYKKNRIFVECARLSVWNIKELDFF